MPDGNKETETNLSLINSFEIKNKTTNFHSGPNTQ